MVAYRTEEASERYRGIDFWPSAEVLSAIVAAQREAIEAVAPAVPSLAAAGEAVAERLRGGGRLIYAGAGSSGLLAQVDALELPGTFGIPAQSVKVLLAGGEQALLSLPADAEDDAAAGERDVDALEVGPQDALVAISASGRTAYPLAAMLQAGRRGALTVGIASNAGAPLLTGADHAVLLATPPEVIAGSTRMNAGTAQKCALNMLSSLVGIRLGHVFEGMMVNLQAGNDKLRRRAVGIVMRAAGADQDEAARALAEAGDEVKTAIVLCAGAPGADDARRRLAEHGGDVRATLVGLARRAKNIEILPKAGRTTGQQ